MKFFAGSNFRDFAENSKVSSFKVHKLCLLKYMSVITNPSEVSRKHPSSCSIRELSIRFDFHHLFDRSMMSHSCKKKYTHKYIIYYIKICNRRYSILNLILHTSATTFSNRSFKVLVSFHRQPFLYSMCKIPYFLVVKIAKKQSEGVRFC